MKKRFLSMLVLLAAVATGAWAQTQWTSGDCTVTLNNGTMTVSGKGAMADLVSEQQPWDNYKNDITSVVVESGVTAIGTGVFDSFKNMTSVTLPEGLTSIGNHAFYSCSSLTSITIPSTVTSIGIDTFWGCEGMTDVYLYADPANLTWAEDACDDFKYFPQGSTQCHVLAEHLSAYETKFTGVVNVTFVGDLKPLTPSTTYSVTLAEGTEDSDKWKVKVGEGEAQAFPVEGLNGGETVTVTYSGDRKVKSVKAVKKGGAPDPQAVPLTIEAITAGTIQVAQPKEGMQYSLNGGAKTAVTTDGIVLNAGDKVQFYGNGTTITSYGGSSSSDCTTITGNGDGFTCKVYGNIMSLVDEENFATAKTLSANYTFKYLFHDNTTLTDASGLLLPAPELKANCYDHMFSNCTALIAAPALPAETLATNCYYSMFANCSALTAAPEELPAETLAAYCYMQMFANCTALTTAPVLTAETLVFRCYYQMFSNCQKLATVTCLATSGIDQEHSTDKWLQNAGTQAQGAKTFNAVSTAEWPSNNNGIPSGWTRVNVDN